MKMYEYQAKKMFALYGIPVEQHRLCHTPEEATAAYEQLSIPTVVVKAQVLTGGRGKAGGIKLAKSKEQVADIAATIMRMKIKEFSVSKILVSEAVHILSEYYVSFIIDRNSKSVTLILSAEGGMDIETVATTSPEKIFTFHIDSLIGIPDYLARRFAFALFSEPEQVNAMGKILQQLYQLFVDKDASLAEINPLVLTKEGALIAIDAKMVIDDNALYRQSDLAAQFEPSEEEKIERYAKENGFSYVHVDGNIGCMVNGAGLAMATMDLIERHGGRPANFLDIGGSSNPKKVLEAMKLLLHDRQVKVVLINIFGGITRCDDVAIGLLKAFEEIETEIPIIVRLSGTNEKEGRELLHNKRFIIANSMSEATKLAVHMNTTTH